jgi:phosphomannomutase
MEVSQMEQINGLQEEDQLPVNNKVLIASYLNDEDLMSTITDSGLESDWLFLESKEDETENVFNFLTLKPAINRAIEEEHGLIIGIEPHLERIAIAVRKSKKSAFVVLNSHQVAAILLKIWMDSGKYENLICVKSIHTSDLIEYMSIKSGLNCISEIIDPGELKNAVREVQKTAENEPICGFNIDQQVFHTDLEFSEIITSIAQKELELRESGLTLFDYLLEIYQEFGFYKEKTITVDISSKTQKSHLLSIMDKIRKNPKYLESIFPLNTITDYRKGSKRSIMTDKVNSFPGSKENILKMESSNNLSVTFAPTETKMTYYISIKGGTTSKEKYADKNKEMDEEILKVIQMLNRGNL